MQTVKEMLTTDKLRKVLKWWGEWQCAIASHGYRLTYPHTSAFVHIGESRVEQTPIPTPSPIVLKVDDGMIFLSKFRPDVYLALRYKYEHQYINIDAAKEMHMSVALYKILVATGESFIAGRIS